MQNYTVLFVDDEPGIVNAMKRLFRGSQFDIVTAQSGAEALEIFGQRDVQVLVTDNLMPEMSGVELVKRVKKCSPRTVRILLSGHSDMESVLEALNDGEVFRFVLKPWVDLDLKATVHLALAHYRLAEQNQELRSRQTHLEDLIEALKERYPQVHDELLQLSSSNAQPETRTT
jgi:DNA-binding NtrC family response regulator